MNDSNSEWIRDYFDASSCDVTPPGLRRDVRLVFVPAIREVSMAQRLGAILSEFEQARACKFRAIDDQMNFLQRRAFRRYCGARALGMSRPLSQVHFIESDKGRPYIRELPDTWFSFSASTSGFLAAWSSSHAVGVDTEDLDQKVEAVELAQYHFTKAEAALVIEAASHARSKTFLRLWTLKEAALKSIGEGMPYGLDVFQFELEPTVQVVRAPAAYGGADKFRVHTLGNKDACTALALRRQLQRGP